MLGYYLEEGPTDQILDQMSNPIRRRLLFSLLEMEETDSEGPHRVSDVAGLEAESVQVVLYHQHLPKLDNAGHIVWERRNNEFSIGPKWSQIEPLLRLLRNHLHELPPQLRGAPSSA